MITLTYGLLKPQVGDKGSIFFSALEDDLDQLDAHIHDGITSALLPSGSIILATQSLLAGSWASLGDGNYRQLVTMPVPLTYNTRVPTFRDTATGNLIFPSVEKVGASSFYVYINDPTIGLTVHYL